MSDPINRIVEALERIAKALEHDATSLPPEALDVEAAARFIGVRPEAIEHLIRVRKLAYVQTGSQRGRVIPVEALRLLLREQLHEVMRLPEGNGKA